MIEYTIVGYAIVGVPVLALLAIVVRSACVDGRGRWPWNEERRLEEELRRARARVEFAEEGLKLRQREEAVREELARLKGEEE